ncbi:MAG: PAS domain S-box protein, partial [Promethearchaeota archaeon]
MKIKLIATTKAGTRIPTEYTASLVKDEHGNPKFIIAVGRDITERKQA